MTSSTRPTATVSERAREMAAQEIETIRREEGVGLLAGGLLAKRVRALAWQREGVRVKT